MKRSTRENTLVYVVRLLSLIYCALIMLYSVAVADDGVFIVNGKYTDAYWFARNCYHATARSVTVYSDSELTQPITTLPAQTFIKTLSEQKWIVEGERCALHIAYITYPSGSRGSGWIEDGRAVGNVVSACTYGGTHLLDIKLNNRKMLDHANDPYIYDDPIYGDLSGYIASNSTKPKGNGNSKPTATAEPAPPVKLNDKEVQISQLGVETSIVILEGEKQTIATADLVFSQDSKDDKHTAVIYAPNTGKCTLRSRGADNGAALKQCKAGIVVGVLEYGSKYTNINYKGNVGYVLTSCLKFYKKDVQSIGTGTIIYSKDKPNVKTTINVRNKTDKASAKVAEWNTGTEVIIFSHSDGWYEVEYNGIHGYIMDTYIKAE